jgi:hypothetical protein
MSKLINPLLVGKRRVKMEFDSNPSCKHPRTFHLPWSKGLTADDRRMEDTDSFAGKEVVVTLKMNGEQTTLYQGKIHARGINGYAKHPSRDMIRALHAEIQHKIPKGMRICGENMISKHAIAYNNLTHPFFVHSVWFMKTTAMGSSRNTCLSWDETTAIAEALGLPTVPVLYRGPYDSKKIKALFQKEYQGSEMEGYVVRAVDAIRLEHYRLFVGKFVRENHVQPDAERWFHSKTIKNDVKKPSRKSSEESTEKLIAERERLKELMVVYHYDPAEVAYSLGISLSQLMGRFFITGLTNKNFGLDDNGDDT